MGTDRPLLLDEYVRRILVATSTEARSAGELAEICNAPEPTSTAASIASTTAADRGPAGTRPGGTTKTHLASVERVSVETDGDGRTTADDVYAAGRIAGKAPRTAIAAGHGAELGITVVLDAHVPFYHDWVTPAGYFSDRDREVPPGCEELDDAERREREAASGNRQRDLLDGEREPPRTHPSPDDEELSRVSGCANYLVRRRPGVRIRGGVRFGPNRASGERRFRP